MIYDFEPHTTMMISIPNEWKEIKAKHGLEADSSSYFYLTIKLQWCIQVAQSIVMEKGCLPTFVIQFR